MVTANDAETKVVSATASGSFTPRISRTRRRSRQVLKGVEIEVAGQQRCARQVRVPVLRPSSSGQRAQLADVTECRGSV
jgi:hypothetical protein